MIEMADRRIHPLIPLLGTALGLVLFAWGLVLVITGHDQAQGWSQMGVGAATFGSAGFSQRRRR